MSTRVASFVSAFALSAFFATAAAAGSRVTIVRPPAPSPEHDATIVRLKAELATAGFDAVEREVAAGDPRLQAERTGGEDAFATIVIVPGAEGAAVDVWIADHVTSKTVVRSIRVSDADASSLVAIRAVELLRASLLESDRVRSRDVPADVATWVNPSPRLVPHAAADAGAALLYSPGGLDAGAGPFVRGWLSLSPALSGRVAFVGPVFVSNVRGPVGSASVRQELALLDLVFHPALASRAVFPTLSLGIGGCHLHAKGALDPAFLAKSDDAWAVLLAGGVGIAWQLVDWVAMTLDARMLVALPKPTVRMRGEAITDVGRPSLSASVGLMARF